jgi:hypothetical protein
MRTLDKKVRWILVDFFTNSSGHHVQDIGDRKDSCEAMTFDSKGNLYYGLISQVGQRFFIKMQTF